MSASPEQAQPASDFLRVMRERGYIHQLSDEAGIDALARAGQLNTYVGYDCTGPSLHVGSLVSIMMLHWLQETGAGKPIVLMGGGTTRVGDPSGKDEARQILTLDQIEANKNGIKTNFQRLVRFGEAASDAAMVDNADWLTKLNYIDFLRDVGRHFSVNRMLSMDSVKLRLEREHELSFLEFNYMCLQSYDFVELNRRFGVRLQMGGSDQWGNIVTGLDLGRRMGAPQLYALTCPLITTASGAKMGKTAAGAMWLSADMLSPYLYWQFCAQHRGCRRRPVPAPLHAAAMPEIARLEALGGAEINEAKKRLATAATALIARPRGRRDRGPRRPGSPSSRAPSPTTSRAWRSRGSNSRPGSACSRPSPGGPRRLDQRGAAPDQGRRPQGQRRDRDDATPRRSGPATSWTAPSSCRSGARSTCC